MRLVGAGNPSTTRLLLQDLARLYQQAIQELDHHALQAFFLHQSEYLLHAPDAAVDEQFIRLYVAQAADYLRNVHELKTRRRKGRVVGSE